MQSCAYYYLYYFLRQKQAQNQSTKNTSIFINDHNPDARRTRRHR